MLADSFNISLESIENSPNPSIYSSTSIAAFQSWTFFSMATYPIPCTDDFSLKYCGCSGGFSKPGMPFGSAECFVIVNVVVSVSVAPLLSVTFKLILQE